MSDVKFIELACQRCGGELKEQNGAYVCANCGKKWTESTLHGFTDMLDACEEALRNQRVADIANLRQLLWKETHKEYVSNIEVERVCKELRKLLPQDFYANFYISTCRNGKTELGDFLYTVNAKEHYEDITLVLDYLLSALKPEWTMGVSNFIEKLKDVDLGLYHNYRTKFENEYNKIEECIFEPAFPRDVFIAYSSKDMPKVSELVAALEEENLTCFVAARNMRHGSGSVEKYEQTLHTAIDHSSVIVFVSSDNSRSVRCDAYKELDYVNKNCRKKPRVELVIKNYSGRATERFFEEFFSGLEYCTSAGDVAERVTKIIMSGGATPEPEPVRKTAPKPEPKPLPKPEPVKGGDVAKKLKRVRILIETGEFKEADERLSKIESDEEERAGECEIAEVYHLKMLLDYGAKNDEQLVEKLINGKEYITGNKNYLLAKNCAEDAENDAELEALLLIKSKSQEGIKNAEAEAKAKAEEEAEVERNRAAMEEAKTQQAENDFEKGESYYNDNNYTEAVKWYKKAAEQGHAEAQFSLGYCYKYGQGVTQDYAEAVKWFRKSAEQGDADAQCHLGSCYKNGQGVTKNYEEAVKWYRKGADQGEMYSQNNLGYCYEKGEGVTQDYEEAVKWYRKAAEQGFASAQNNLGVCYENGQGVTKSYTEAVKWYKKAAEQGEMYAQKNLGICYRNGQGVTQDYVEAVKWFRKSAEQGYGNAQNWLGYCYENGQGVTKSYTEAVKWYRKAADQGEAYAQNNLGVLYKNGQGVTKNYAEAVKWYRKAADQGEMYAQYNLGYCYINGEGVTRNYSEAVKWFRKSAKQGHSSAREWMNKNGESY